MSAQLEVSPWDRQTREGERAYAAFLAYRDLGPRRTLEATRMRLGQGPGSLKPIERWSASRDWCQRACAWDAHRQAERDEIARAEAEKWERRRLQALEEGWQLCQALRARLMPMLAMPPEAPAAVPPEPPRERPEAVPEAGAPPREARPTADRGPSRSNDLALARLAKLVIELEWAILAEALPPPGAIDPLTATPQELDTYLAHPPRPVRPPRR